MEKTKQESTLTLAEILKIPRHNYRKFSEKLSKEEVAELTAFGSRILMDGQQTPVRIAKVFGATKEWKDIEVSKRGEILIDGERRIRGLELALKAQDGLEEDFHVSVKYFDVPTMKEFKRLQMGFNKDRKGTSFTEDGFGFMEYTQAGGTIKELIETHPFPQGVITKAAKTRYIKDRMDLISLDISLHSILDKGLLRVINKKHQGYLVKEYSPKLQQALAAELTEFPKTVTNDQLTGFFNKFQVKMKEGWGNNGDWKIDIEAEIANSFGNGACSACSNFVIDKIESNNYDAEEEKEWNEEEEGSPYPYVQFIEKPYCYNEACFDEKREAVLVEQEKEVIAQYPHFVWADVREYEAYRYDKETNPWIPVREHEDGRKVFNGYKIVEEGSCANSLPAMHFPHDHNSERKGILIHICTPGCSVHYGADHNEKMKKRTEKQENEKVNATSKVITLTGYEWIEKAMAKKDAFPLIQKEISKSVQYYAINQLMHYMDKKAISVVNEQLKGAYFSRDFWKVSFEKQIGSALEKWELETITAIMYSAYLVNDMNKHNKIFPLWGEMAGIDYNEMLKANSNEALAALKEKHQKQKGNWQEEENKLKAQLKHFMFDLPFYYDADVTIENSFEIDDEKTAKTIARKVGIKMIKGMPFISKEFVTKLTAKYTELMKLNFDVKLSEIEEKLTIAAKRFYIDGTHETKHEYAWPTDTQIYNFVDKAISIAERDDNIPVVCEFLLGKSTDSAFKLPIGSKEAIKVGTDAIRALKLKGVSFSKDHNTYSFVKAEFREPKEETEGFTPLQEVLNNCTIDAENMTIAPPARGVMPLEAKLYAEFKKAMTGNGGIWKGGKKQHFQFKIDPTDVYNRLLGGEKVNLKKEFQDFETPDALADRLVDLADMAYNDSILEPQAGGGQIIRAIRRAGFEQAIHVCEIQPNKFRALSEMDKVFPQKQDFLDMVEPDDSDKYDRIIANPPFSKNQDTTHFIKMCKMLKEGGKVISIMSQHWRFASDKKSVAFRGMLDRADHEVIELESGDFKESGTMIKACILILDKPVSAEVESKLLEAAEA